MFRGFVSEGICRCLRELGGSSQRFSATKKGSYTLHDRVMDLRPHLLDRLIGAIRPGAIGQKRNRQLPIRINPERGSCVPEVAVRVRSEVCARL